MMADEVNAPKASDLLSVRSRVSWGAIIAGAMVALTIYVVLTLLGVLIGLAATVQGSKTEFTVWAGLYTVITLALAMFFGGWTSSRLAVGEDKLEAILYAVILWGVLFLMMIYLAAAGVTTGYSAMMGGAANRNSGTTAGGGMDVDRITFQLRGAGVSEETIEQIQPNLEKVRDNPIQAAREAMNDPATQKATAWTLSGVLVSLLVVIMGALVGSGEVPIPVPLIGVRRPVR